MFYDTCLGATSVSLLHGDLWHPVSRLYVFIIYRCLCNVFICWKQINEIVKADFLDVFKSKLSQLTTMHEDGLMSVWSYGWSSRSSRFLWWSRTRWITYALSMSLKPHIRFQCSGATCRCSKLFAFITHLNICNDELKTGMFNLTLPRYTDQLLAERRSCR